MNEKLVILRSNFDRQTLGNMLVMSDTEVLFQCKTLELVWKNNERKQSCIPEGAYEVVKHESPTFGACFWIKNVPNRAEILIHPANYYSDLLGCVGVGQAHTDINGDGLRDITNSKKTMETLLKLLPSKFKLEIVNL
jgi:hypothetical protein